MRAGLSQTPASADLHGHRADDPLRWFAVALPFLLLVSALAVTRPAFADGGVQCTGMWLGGELYQPGETLSTSVSPPLMNHEEGSPYRICLLEFDKNVSYAKGGDDSFVQRNIERIHLVRVNGTEVAGSYVTASNLESDKKYFTVMSTSWLDPLTEYRVVVDAGMEAQNGEDISGESCVFTFKTSAMLTNGFTVYQIAIAVVLVLALAAGIAIQAVRISKRRS